MEVAPPLHEALAPVAGLLGTFTGAGRGTYPTVAPFTYTETVSFGHVGTPVLRYEQRTRSPVTGAPMHAESGFLRVPPAGDDGRRRGELVVAHVIGIVEVEEGPLTATADGVVLELASTTLARTSSALEVRSLRRRFELVGDELRYELWMATPGTSEASHLTATLHRVVEEPR